MAEMKYFEDFNVGDRIVTRGRTITEADIVMFSAFSGDWHPLHTDVEYAKQGPFKERIAHGFLVLSVASGLLPLSEIAIIAFYGMDKVRFIAPVRLLDTIHVEFTAIDKQDRDERGGVITFRETIRNQRGEEVVVGTMRSYIAKREAGTA
ncbi:MAG: MaoC/PaaZ C-terminal domain-containing protein [Chloroflexi bacterium]|nr:MaoC/PaaZ C-terminal domain-containing protein [Chloroflexota bacterium]